MSNLATRPELTFEEFGGQRLQYTRGLTLDWGAHRLYRNEELGIQKEVVTKRKRHGDLYGGWHDGQVAFFLDGDDRQFDTVDQLYVAYMAKVCGVPYDGLA